MPIFIIKNKNFFNAGLMAPSRMGMGSKHNSSRTENLPTSNVGILVKNQFWSSLVTSLKKAKAHMIVEPKGVDV